MAKLKDEQEEANHPEWFGYGEDGENGKGDGKPGGKRGRRGSALTQTDMIEREVRKRMAELMSSAGVQHGRISQEVLYWLPEDFTRLYMILTYSSLRMDDGVSSSMGGQTGDEGQIKAKVGTGPDRGKTAGGLFTESMSGSKSGAHARGTGKRYRNHWLIKDEEAFNLKLEVDRKLRELGLLIENRGKGKGKDGGGGKEGGKEKGVGGGGKDGRGGEAEPQGVNPGDEKGEAGQTREDDLVKFISGDRTLIVGRNGGKRCKGCGKIAKGDWVICPNLHA